MPLFKPDDPDLFFVQGRHGAFTVNRHDCYVGVSLIVYGEYSEDEWRLFGRFISPGAWALDIGANVGAFSIPMARKAGERGKIVSFEPQPQMRELLRLNAETNQLHNIDIFPWGLGDRAEQRETEIPAYDRDGNFGGACFVNGGQGLTAEFRRLDDVFDGPRLDVIKMDVESMETEAITGAADTLHRCRPVLYVENHPGKNSPRLIGALTGLGYRMWWHTPFYFNPDNYLKQTENLYPGQLSVNMICLPVERLDLIPLIPAGLLPVDGPGHSLAENGTIRVSLASN